MRIPVPNISQCFDSLQGTSVYSCLDFCSGYLQVEMDPADREKTSFVTREGLFQYKVMPFGLCNAVSTFERLMEQLFAGLLFHIMLIYLDDLIIFSNGWEEQLFRLRLVFQRIRVSKLKLKPRKCHLFKEEVLYLGHLVSRDGISTDPGKIAAVKDWPRPTTVTEVRGYLGFCSYYRKFIEKFSEIASPLHALTGKDKKFCWSEECERSFETLKERLTTSPILAYPRPDCEFILDTDASDKNVGAVLSQEMDGQERVIAYASKSLGKSERRYCVTRKELSALVYFIKYFKHYLYGKKFTTRVDHAALRWLYNFREPEGQTARWIETLSNFEFSIIHRAGRSHRKCGRNEPNTL